MKTINSITELAIGEYPVELLKNNKFNNKYKTNFNNCLNVDYKIVYAAKANNHLYIITYCVLYGFINIYKDNTVFMNARAIEQLWCSDFVNDDVVLFSPMSDSWNYLLQNNMIINPDDFEDYMSFDILNEKFYSVTSPVSVIVPTLLHNQSNF